MKKFVTEDSFWQLFPGASLGVIVARGMKPANEISPEDAQAIEQLLIRANALAEKHLESPTLSENAPVRAWRQAYQQFKTKRGARCSIENLLKRVLKGNPVGSISPSVDLYNAISLKYALPLGEGAENDPTLPGELAYVDDAGAVCRCWNWRDGVRTALTDNTGNAFLIVECVDSGRIEDCRAATEELAQLVEQHLGATIAVAELITYDHREAIIEP